MECFKIRYARNGMLLGCDGLMVELEGDVACDLAFAGGEDVH